MNNLFKSKIFKRQFFSSFLIICITFFTISLVLLSATRISLERQQSYIVENYRTQASQAILTWLSDKEYDIKNQALYISKLDENKICSSEVSSIINEQLSWSKNFLDILIMDDLGTVINSAGGSSGTVNLSNREYFKNGIKGQNTITGFYGSTKKGLPVMAIGVPVYFDGQPKYVLAGIISLERVKEIVENQNFGNWGHAYLVDSEGMFITNSMFIKEFFRGIENKDKYKIDSLAVSEVLLKKNGTTSYTDFMGQMVFGSYEWLEPLKVGLIVEFKTHKIMKPINDLMTVIGILAAIVILIGGLFSFLFSRRIITPVKVLVEAIENIISHNYEKPVDIKTHTELDILVDHFNNMQDIIRSREEQLECKNRELIIRTQEAVKANMLKGQFLANMSHELRTPLNSIIGFTTRVIKKSGHIISSSQLEDLNIVLEQARHLLDLINNLLDFSKLESGKLQINPELFNITEVAEEAFDMVKKIAEEKNIKYEQKFFSMTDIPIYSDRMKVKQILINLLSNAFKYSEKGTVKLSIDKNENFYCISVADEGIGMAPEDINDIFDEFYQIDGSFTRKAGGTGLGLSITKHFVEMLDGSINVTSSPEMGSCFTVCLPLKYRQVK